jgi:hypothetical protein
VSIGPSSGNIERGRVGRPALRTLSLQFFGRIAGRRLAAVALAMATCASLVTPALGAESPASGANPGVIRQASGPAVPQIVAPPDTKDAFEGGYVPPARDIVFPSLQLGLTQQRPIPLGVTCSCTIDRVGLVSQFDITVIQVVQDAFPMVQQLNRFNRPPRPGARYVAAYVGQQYVAGPENQAYTSSESDWKSTANDGRLSDTAQLLHTEIEFRPKADVFPKNYVNGWLIYELPMNRPAFLVWNYNFVGERGIWFALQ